MSEPVRKGREFWSSPIEAITTIDVVHHHPRHDGESAVCYIERIAILAGLMPASRAAYAANAKLGAVEATAVATQALRPMPVDSWLPYAEPREPGEEG